MLNVLISRLNSRLKSAGCRTLLWTSMRRAAVLKALLEAKRAIDAIGAIVVKFQLSGEKLEVLMQMLI